MSIEVGLNSKQPLLMDLFTRLVSEMHSFAVGFESFPDLNSVYYDLFRLK